MKTIITIEIETVENSTKRTISIGDKKIYKSETSSLFETTDNNLLENLRRTIIELERNGNLNDVDYPKTII